MAKLIFKLKNVPDDEADDIRLLLNENEITFYETTAGNWGASMPAIWVPVDEDADNAKKLIDSYQQQRSQQAKETYKQEKLAGTTRTLFDVFKQEPFRVTVFFSVIALILYVSVRIVTDLY